MVFRPLLRFGQLLVCQLFRRRDADYTLALETFEIEFLDQRRARHFRAVMVG